MGNCLVTKFNSVVQNDNLEKLNVLTFSVVSDFTFRFISNSNAIITSTLGMDCQYGTPSDGQTVLNTTVQGNSEASIILHAGSKVSIENKYDIKKFRAIWNAALDIDITKFAYSQLRDIYAVGENVYGDLKSFETVPSIIKIELSSSKVTGSLKNLVNCHDIEKISIDGNHGIEGNVVQLGTLTKLAEINIYHTGVIGSVEGLAAAQVEAGRTNGTLSVIYSAPVTYNETEPVDSGTKTITFDSSLPNGYSIS